MPYSKVKWFLNLNSTLHSNDVLVYAITLNNRPAAQIAPIRNQAIIQEDFNELIERIYNRIIQHDERLYKTMNKDIQRLMVKSNTTK